MAALAQSCQGHRVKIMAKQKKKPEQANETQMTALDFIALRRRRNFAVFGGIIFLCVVFYLITIVRLGVS